MIIQLIEPDKLTSHRYLNENKNCNQSDKSSVTSIQSAAKSIQHTPSINELSSTANSQLALLQCEVQSQKVELAAKEATIEGLKSRITNLEDRESENCLLDDKLVSSLKNERDKLSQQNSQLELELKLLKLTQSVGSIPIERAKGWLTEVRCHSDERESHLKDKFKCIDKILLSPYCGSGENIVSSIIDRIQILLEMKTTYFSLSDELLRVKQRLAVKEDEFNNLNEVVQRLRVDNASMFEELQTSREHTAQFGSSSKTEMIQNEVTDEVEMSNQQRINELTHLLDLSQGECAQFKSLIKVMQSRLDSLKKVLKREIVMKIARNDAKISEEHEFTDEDVGSDKLQTKDTTDDPSFVYMRHVLLKFMLSGHHEAMSLVAAVCTLLRLSNEEKDLLIKTLEYRVSWFGTKKPSYGKGQFSRIIHDKPES